MATAKTTGRKPKAPRVGLGWAGGFDGKGYEINALKARLEKLPSPGWVRLIVIHNTATPDMKRTAQIGPSRYVKNVASYYRDKLGWSSGPHYFVADSQPDALVFEGTPITSRGTHSPCWNGNSIGIEMCANFVRGVDDDDTGGGLRIKDTTCQLAAALLYKLGLPANNDTVKLHKEDRCTTHDCPGKDIEKPDMLVRIRQYLADMAPAGEHDTKEKDPLTPAKRGVVNADGLILRAGSGLANSVVAVLSKGTGVEILNSAQNAVTTWLYVKVPSRKKKGWLSGRYVEVDGKPVPQPIADQSE